MDNRYPTPLIIDVPQPSTAPPPAPELEAGGPDGATGDEGGGAKGVD